MTLNFIEYINIKLQDETILWHKFIHVSNKKIFQTLYLDFFRITLL